MTTAYNSNAPTDFSFGWKNAASSMVNGSRSNKITQIFIDDVIIQASIQMTHSAVIRLSQHNYHSNRCILFYLRLIHVIVLLMLIFKSDMIVAQMLQHYMQMAVRQVWIIFVADTASLLPGFDCRTERCFDTAQESSPAANTTITTITTTTTTTCNTTPATCSTVGVKPARSAPYRSTVTASTSIHTTSSAIRNASPTPASNVAAAAQLSFNTTAQSCTIPDTAVKKKKNTVNSHFFFLSSFVLLYFNAFIVRRFMHVGRDVMTDSSFITVIPRSSPFAKMSRHDCSSCIA